jgi:hypothetical protein
MRVTVRFVIRQNGSDTTVAMATGDVATLAPGQQTQFNATGQYGGGDLHKQPGSGCELDNVQYLS